MLAALWSHRGGVILQSNAEKGNEWSSWVREATQGETVDVEAVDIPWLLDRSPYGYIDVLKIDIEGAEERVLAQGYERWLGGIGMILIELHSERSRKLLFEAISSGNFRVSQRGEITIIQSLAGMS
jgi:FkbM family methyltransferase